MIHGTTQPGPRPPFANQPPVNCHMAPFGQGGPSAGQGQGALLPTPSQAVWEGGPHGQPIGHFQGQLPGPFGLGPNAAGVAPAMNPTAAAFQGVHQPPPGFHGIPPPGRGSQQPNGPQTRWVPYPGNHPYQNGQQTNTYQAQGMNLGQTQGQPILRDATNVPELIPHHTSTSQPPMPPSRSSDPRVSSSSRHPRELSRDSRSPRVSRHPRVTPRVTRSMSGGKDPGISTRFFTSAARYSRSSSRFSSFSRVARGTRVTSTPRLHVGPAARPSSTRSRPPHHVKHRPAYTGQGRRDDLISRNGQFPPITEDQRRSGEIFKWVEILVADNKVSVYLFHPYDINL